MNNIIIIVVVKAMGWLARGNTKMIARNFVVKFSGRSRARMRWRAAEASSSTRRWRWRRWRRWLSFRVRSCAVGGGGARVCAPAVTAERSAGRHECARYRSATWSRSSPASQWRSGRSSCVIFTNVHVPRNDHVSHDRVYNIERDQHAPASFFSYKNIIRYFYNHRRRLYFISFYFLLYLRTRAVIPSLQYLRKREHTRTW